MAVDPYFNDVISLLPLDGAAGSTAIIDKKGLTWTAKGAAQISTTQSKWGGASAVFGGKSADYIVGASAADTNLGGVFTAELWFYLRSNTGYGAALIGQAGSGQGEDNFLGVDISGVVNYYRGASQPGGELNMLGSTQVTLNAWHHIALCFDGHYAYLFLDGHLEDKSANTNAWANSSAMRLGNQTVGGYEQYASFLDGFIDDVRLTSGFARYTASFTVPAAPFPAGDFNIHGITKIDGAPTSRIVQVVDGESLQVFGQTISDPADGTFSITFGGDGAAVYAFALDDYGHQWMPDKAYAALANTFSTAPNGHWYQATVAGTSGSAEPTWPTDGTTVTDGTVTWQDMGTMRAPVIQGPIVPEAA